MQAIKEAAAAAAKAASLRAAKAVKSRQKYGPKMLKKLGSASQIDKRKLKEGKNAFDVLARFRSFGIGQTLTRKIWQKYWTDPKGPGRNTGRVWGFRVWKGKLFHLGEERRIHAANKRGWKLVDPAQVNQLLAHSQLPVSTHHAAEAAAAKLAPKPSVTAKQLFGEAIQKAAKV